MAFAQNTQVDADIERISVYEKQNRVVMSSGLATKSDMSLMETPAPVVIIDRELIESQGVDSLQDLVRNVSGLTQAGNNYGIGDNLVIRGLDANYTYDGMYGGAGLGNTFNPTRSLTNVESVEVLKGPATGLYGIGSAGGVINLIEKKPEFEEKHKVSAELGQWDSYSLSFDSTNAITDDLAYRVMAKTASSDGFRDLKEDRDEIYTSLKYVLNDRQNIMLSAAYIKDEIAVDSIGHPIRIYNAETANGLSAGEVTGADLVNDPTGSGVQLSDAQRDQLANSLSASDGLTPYSFGTNGIISPMADANEGEELRFKLTHNYYITDDLFLNQQLQYRNYTSSFARQTGAYNYVYSTRDGIINNDPRAPLVEDFVLYPYAARRQEYRQVEADEKSWQYFLDLRYDFMLGDVDNELLVNANYEDRDIRFKQFSIWDQDYVLTNNDGDVIDSSIDDAPLSYLHGAGNIVPGLETALLGKSVGENLKVTIQPDDAYGERHDDMVQVVPREMFQGVEDIQPGMQFQAEAPDGGIQMIVVADVADNEITVDANHPLAGVVLNFDVSIEAVREPTPEELDHGHVH